MNTDMGQLIVVLRSILRAAKKGKMSGPDYSMCSELLECLEVKYRSGVAAVSAAAVVLQEVE